MRGQYACVSIKNVNALRLTDIPTTLKPRFYIMTSNSKGVMMNNQKQAMIMLLSTSLVASHKALIPFPQK